MSGANYGRTHWVTKFRCATCGTYLTLSYDGAGEGHSSVNDGITGADKVETIVRIEPCETCVAVPLKQLKTLREILKG